MKIRFTSQLLTAAAILFLWNISGAAAEPEQLGDAEEQLAAECAEFKGIWEIYKTNAEKINDELQPKSETLQQKYRNTLETMKGTAQNRGDLEKVQAIIAEMERFEETKRVPSTPDEDAIAEIKALHANAAKPFAALEKDRSSRMTMLAKRYGQALEQLQTSLVKSGKLEEATAVKEAQERVRRALVDLAAQQEAAAPAKPAPASGKAHALALAKTSDPKIQKALTAKIEDAKQALAERKDGNHTYAATVLYADTEDPRDLVNEVYVGYTSYASGAGTYGITHAPFREASMRLEYLRDAAVNRRITLDPGPPYEAIEMTVELKADEVTNLGRIVFRKVKANGTADVCGTVRDQDGEPMPDVPVVAGTKKAVTDKDGQYRLKGFGLEYVNLKAEMKGYAGGEARLAIRNMDRREIQQDLQLYKPKSLVLNYVISAPKSDSFIGEGTAQGTLKLTLNEKSFSFMEIKTPSSSLNEFLDKTRMSLGHTSKGIVFRNGMAPIYYETYGFNTPFDSVETTGKSREQRCLPLEKGHVIVIRGANISEYSVKFFVEEIADAP